MDPMDFMGTPFYSLIQHEWNLSKSLTNRKMCFSIGIYSLLIDPMDSIRTTFHPLIQHERNFSKSLTNRKWTFPSESIRVQWIRWTPSERLSTPSSNMSEIFLSLSRTENQLFHRNLFWDFTPLDFRFSDGKLGDTTGFWSTVLDNPRSLWSQKT